MSSAALRPALIAALEELQLPLADAQVDALLAYLGLLQKWNAVYNLTAVRDPVAMLTQHLTDCLAAVKPLSRVLDGKAARVLDVGSGGGLPAVAIAAALPALQVTSVDTVGKKVAFVRQVAAELRLGNLNALQARVEHVKAPAFDIVVCRAFASLDDFVRLSGSSLKHGGRWMAMKGRMPADEITALPASIEVFHVEPLVVPGLAAERCLVWLRRTGETTETRSL